MHFPKYWALGSSGDYSCWQWSDVSNADAQTKAKNAATRLAELRKSSNARGSQYDYGFRALREPVLQEITGSKSEPVGVITRNSYGARVLNTTQVCFVDIDSPKYEIKPKSKGFFASLFGSKGPEAPKPEPQIPAVERVQQWFVRNPSWGARLYETRGGFRLLITTHLLDPAAGSTEQLFGELGADPLYCRLCKNQNSFRARLSPKPWRCNSDMPPARWPFLNDAQVKSFDVWNKKYETERKAFATCRYLKNLGSSETIPEVESILSIHDGETAVTSGRPLA